MACAEVRVFRSTTKRCAKRLFIERGYGRTTMARDDMSDLKREGEDPLSRLPADPIEAVFKLLQVYGRVYEFISYGVMQEFIIHAKSNGPLHETSDWVLRWQQEQVARALKQCQERGSVSEELILTGWIGQPEP